MGFGLLWPAVFFILLPAVILLYILKQKAKPYEFSSILLWKEAYRNLESTKPWEKLKKNILLFLQLLILFLMITAMMSPWISGTDSSKQSLVLVIDNSASMETIYDGEKTRLEEAKEEACAYVNSLPASVEIDVIECSDQASLVIANSRDYAEVRERILNIGQTVMPGDLSSSLGMVSSCTSSEDTKIIFFTDSAFDSGYPDAEIVSLYSEQANLSLDSLNCSGKNGKTEVLAMVTNDSAEDVTEDVNLYGIFDEDPDKTGQERLLDIQSISVPAGGSQAVLFEIEPQENLTALHANLNQNDALKTDNDAWCVPEEVQSARVLLVTESNLFAEKAFSVLAGVDVSRTSDPAAAEETDSSAGYDLYIFDGILPDTLPASGSFLFVNCETLPLEEKIQAASVVSATKLNLSDTEVTAYVAGTEIGVNQSYVYDLPAWASSFLSAGSQSAGFYGNLNGHRIAVLGFDLHQTDFALTMQFPVLISDLTDYLLTGNLVERSSCQTGETLSLYGNTRGEDLVITEPDGSARNISAADSYNAGLSVSKPGIYRIAQSVNGQEVSAVVAANFPVSESHISPAAETDTQSAGDMIPAGTGSYNLKKILIALAMLLLCTEFAIFIHRMPKRRPVSGKVSEIVLRAVVMLTLLLAVCGVTIKKSSSKTTTVFLIDASDSMSSSLEEEETFVRQAIGEMGTNDQAGIIVFGEDARIEQFVSDQKNFTEIQSAVVSSATNLEQAIQSALALFPDETGKRLVLLTDGKETEGDALSVSTALSEAGAELKVVEYDSISGDEVYVDNVSMPDTISQGEQFQVTVDIYSTSAEQAVVSLYSGRTLKSQKEVILQKGNNRLVFTDQGVEQGICSYRVTVDAGKDTLTVNNTYSAYTSVEAPPAILVVEGSENESSEFEKLLDAGSFSYDTVSPSAVPATVSDLLRYDAVVMVDVYADDLRTGFLDALDTYVKDYAGGLVAIGGANSYALGNYQNTKLEEMLPVSSELQGEKQVPSIAMVMIIDHSGSMDSPSTEKGSVTCLDVAKNAAINALDSLREIDQVGVLAFDDSYDWAVPLEAADDTAAIAGQISMIPSGGGTSIYPAIEEAVNELEKSDAAIKHIVLLTDGEDYYRDYDELMASMEEDNITLSSVAIGSGADTGLLQNLAQKCGGRYYYSDAGTALPRIFAQEIFLSTESYLINEEFTPLSVNSHAITEGLLSDGCPSMLGYVATTIKSESIEILESDRQDPILAVRQYGLGKTVAWTSDAVNEWTGNFAKWENYPALWKNILDFCMADTTMGDDTLKAEQEGNGIKITYSAANYSATTSVSAVVTNEEGSQQEITLHPVSPGTYEGSAELSGQGVYSLSLRNRDGEELVKSINTAAAIQYSGEYRIADTYSCLNRLIEAAGGRKITGTAEVYDTSVTGKTVRTDMTVFCLLLAVLFFMLDIICRRLSLDWAAELRKFSEKLSDRLRSSRTSRLSAKHSGPPASGKEPVSGKEPASGKKPAAGRNNGSRKANRQKMTSQPETIDTSALLKKKKDRNL